MPRIRKSEENLSVVNSGEILWRIAVYIRLSREDGNDESLSVTNQKKIIKEYLEGYFKGQFTIADYYIDDGQSGTDYARPDFQRMLSDMEAGKINCIVCKNLSRMFRNYSDQGYFLEKVFPLNKIRFITVSDPKIDSFLHPETLQGLEVPINGLMNDRFAAKTSHDIRDTFATKRRKGEFIGAFAPFGYKKSTENKNALVIDDEAAQVVREVFRWFVAEGMSKMAIAKRLNEGGFLNPTAYKRSKGLKFCCPQMADNDGYWSAAAVSALLKNPVYIGTMVQGRQMVVSYKVHQKVAVPEDEWFIVENTHPPIVEKELFQKAQSLQKRDTRRAPKEGQLHLFAGFIRCADCKKAMTRQKTKNIVYYYCRTFRDKSKKLCTKHTVKEENLKKVLLAVIEKQLQLITDLSRVVEEIAEAPPIQNHSTRLIDTLKQRKKNLERVTSIIDDLYADWKNGDISQEEYHRMKVRYLAQSEQLLEVIGRIEEESRGALKPDTPHNTHLSDFLKYHKIGSLERSILVDLLKNIYVHEGGGVEVEFNFSDPYENFLKNIETGSNDLKTLV